MVMRPDDVDSRSDAPRDEEPEVVTSYAGTGVTAVVLALGLLAAAAIALLAQNTESVPVEFLWLEGEVPLYVLFLVTALAASLATVLATAVWRRRRRRSRSEHEELVRLRQRAS